MRHLNLDIVLGIICTELFAQVVIGIHVRPAWWFVVPTAAWLMYTTDRLLDVRSQGEQYNTPRHQFHLRHRRILWIAVACLTPVTCAAALLFLLPDVWIVGAVLGSLTLLHVASQRPGLHSVRGVLKDATVVIIYTSAVWSVPMLRRSAHPISAWLFPIAFLFLAMQNVILFGLIERPSDESLDRPSAVRTLGTKHSVLLLHACAVMALASSIGIATSNAPHALTAAMIVVVMTITLEALYVTRRTVATPELYRLIGDGVFFVPALIVLVP